MPEYRHHCDAFLLQIDAHHGFGKTRDDVLLCGAFDQQYFAGIEQRGPGRVEVSLKSATSSPFIAGIAVGLVNVLTAPPEEVKTICDASGTPERDVGTVRGDEYLHIFPL